MFHYAIFLYKTLHLSMHGGWEVQNKMTQCEHFYKAWNKFTCRITFIHFRKQNYISETRLPEAKQIYKWRNTFTSPENKFTNDRILPERESIKYWK